MVGDEPPPNTARVLLDAPATLSLACVKLPKSVASVPCDAMVIKSIISEDEGGEVVIKEVQLDFNNQNNNTEKLTDPETTFEPLTTQLAKAQVNFDDYGDKLLRSL